MVLGAAFDYRRYRKFAIPLLILGVILLALIFTPLGHTANNATRWLKIGPITFMPGEFAKLFVIIFTAWFLSEKPDQDQIGDQGDTASWSALPRYMVF